MSVQDMQKAKESRTSKISQAKKDAEEAGVLRKYIVEQGHKDPGPGVSLSHLHALAHALKSENDKNAPATDNENDPKDPAVDKATGEVDPPADKAKGNQPPWLKAKGK